MEVTDLTQEQELALLQKKYDKIISLSESNQCTNSEDWLITAIGAKACGGPTGFIAYSKNLDTVNFLNLVTAYTANQKTYNQKWGVISDCSIPPSPSSIKCENNLPVFVY